MKTSYNWLKQYIETDLPAEEMGDILTEIGLEVEGIDDYVSVEGGFEGLVVGEVLTCERHPNADKLSATTVNIGQGEPLSIVCGAPNVAAGQKVIVATVGTTLYPTVGDSFKIKKSKIRGVTSQGMICAEDEIGLGTSHEGIMVLDANTMVGTSAADYFKIEKDKVFDIGLTPNRSDATNHLGVAQDVAAALTINYNYKKGVNYPSVDTFKIDNQDMDIEVSVENTDACPRYTGVCINNITIKESPEWLQHRLKAVGVRPINNVVDITNFVLHELGQPLHAFDYREITDKKIIVKNLPQDSTFLSLDEVERKLSNEDLMICDGASNGMCIGGVFGGIKSGVKEDTTAIFLESAHFDPTSIRRTSMRHGLRTDAAKVFEKGSDPNITLTALKRAALLIKELAGGQIASEVVDIYPTLTERNQISFTYANVNRLIGQTITIEEVKTIFNALDITFVEETEAGGTVAIPTNKFDVIREADLIEEILRIYGFNKIEIPTAIKSSITYGVFPDPYKVRNQVADFLASAGFNEMMAMSITKTKYATEIFDYAQDSLVFINNTSNQNMDLMRPTMLFSGLDAILHNQNHQNRNLKLFEFGRTYRKHEGDIIEKQHLTIFLTGQKYSESWLNKDKAAVDFYTLKSMVNNVLLRLGIQGYQIAELEDEQFSTGLRYHRGPKTLVRFGQVKGKVTRKIDIKSNVFYADFEWDAIFKMLKRGSIKSKELSKYPSVRRDLALVIDKSVNFKDIASIAAKNAKKILTNVNLFDVYESEERLGKGKKSYAVSFVFQDAQKTLKDKEVEKVMKKLISTYERQLGAMIRK